MNFNKNYIFSFIALMFLLVACDSNRILEENMAIGGDGWNVKDKVKMELDVVDPSQSTNFYVNVRHAEDYGYSNLFLFIKTIFPSGDMAVDTLECILADGNGNWLGSGVGDVYGNQIPFKKNVRFPTTGKYKFEIEHGMRVDVVPLIMDVGLRIEKAD